MGNVVDPRWSSPTDVTAALAEVGYLADEGLATAVFLAVGMERPLFLEGDPGVGKTELARALAAVDDSRLIRLQCYEGIDLGQAVYEWDHARQLVHLRALEAARSFGDPSSDGFTGPFDVEARLWTEEFLIRRPVLEALTPSGGGRPVLLIDEVDRADDEFEALLLEVLSDYAITVPELGTFQATEPPLVVLTSNRTRDVHDALKRRCLYHWLEHPDFDREVAIIGRRAPHVDPLVARRVAALTEQFRNLGLYKPPGVAEAVDWASALHLLGSDATRTEDLDSTLGAVLKYREDAERVRSLGLAGMAASAADRAR